MKEIDVLIEFKTSSLKDEKNSLRTWLHHTSFRSSNFNWEQLEADLPEGPDGNPILLVPDALATEKYGFSAEKYVYQIILVYLQNEHLEKGSPLVTY